MPETHIVAILYPASDKLNRFNELMEGMIKDVHGKEDYTLRYMMTEKLESEGSPEFVMIETYKDTESADKHTQTDHFKELFGKFDKEGVFAKAPYLAKTKTKLGFDLDRKLV